MTFDIITFGSSVIDIFAETESERTMQVCQDDECKSYLSYESGSKNLIHEIHTDIGGGGTNTAACFARLGLSVGFGGSVSTDQHGQTVMSWLDDTGVAFVGSRTDAKQNMSIILDSKQLHDRAILAYKDASNKFRFSALDKHKLSATWFYFSSHMDEAFDAMVETMEYARQAGIAVAFNPSSYLAKKGLGYLGRAVMLSTLLVLNLDEARLLLGWDRGGRSETAKALRDAGAEIVLVTDASQGATLLYADTFYHAKPEPADVVETTGAGDCFAASFVAGLDLGLEPEQALRLAFINVESLIGQVGAKAGLLDRDEAMARLQSDSRKIHQEPL